MLPCSSSNCCHSLENQTEIRQVGSLNIKLERQKWMWHTLFRYRRRQRLYVEMEQMASRPFGQVLTELERIPDTSSESSHHSRYSNKHDQYKLFLFCFFRRKRRKKSRPSPIALEPCAGNRAAVLSLIVRMPTGGHSYAAPGTPGNIIN